MTAAEPALLLDPERLAALLALSFFFGLAFEEYFAASRIKPPGGVRTFPLIALTGALLYVLDPAHGLLLLGGLLVLGFWLGLFYRVRLADERPDLAETNTNAPTRIDGGIIAPICNLIAFLLGPITLTQPLWAPVGIAVFAVLIIGARARLHRFAATLRDGEIVTLAKFLIIIGVVLPLVPNAPVTALTDITPYQVWLAVVAVSTLSYASYLVQRYLAPTHGITISAALGGLYSSTATTVVLSRRARASSGRASQEQSAIVLATAIMFLRILVVVAIFNLTLAKVLALPVLALCVIGLGLSFALAGRGDKAATPADEQAAPTNPLEVSTALIFAALFIALSIAVAWAKVHFGEEGLFALGAIAGVTDVDPFVLNIAQGSATLNINAAAAAILIAASSNNILKAGYTLALAGRGTGLKPSLALFALSFCGLAAAYITFHA